MQIPPKTPQTQQKKPLSNHQGWPKWPLTPPREPSPLHNDGISRNPSAPPHSTDQVPAPENPTGAPYPLFLENQEWVMTAKTIEIEKSKPRYSVIRQLAPQTRLQTDLIATATPLTNYFSRNELLLGPRIYEGRMSSVNEGWYAGKPVAIKIPKATPSENEKLLREMALFNALLDKSKAIGIEACFPTFSVGNDNKIEQRMLGIMPLHRGFTLFQTVLSLRALIRYNLDPRQLSHQEPHPPAEQTLFRFAKALNERRLLTHETLTLIAQHYTNEYAKALYNLHLSRITHGDGKPENAVVTPNHSIKLIDFGFSRFSQERLIEGQGTPLFYPPEMSDLQLLRDFKDDIFTLGLIFLDLKGCHPENHPDYELHKRTPEQMVHALNAINWNHYLDTLDNVISPAENQLLKQMLTRNPEDRCGVLHVTETLERLLTTSGASKTFIISRVFRLAEQFKIPL